MGTVLSANEDDSQGLRVTFTPTNTTNYNSASKTVYIFVNKANQTISFGTLSNRIVGNAFTASATAPGGAVVFTSQTPAVCTTTGTNGATVTSVATGSCTIRASQGGDANWNPAPSVDRSFTVNPSTWSLSTTKNGTGSGTLVATGINCGTDCTETYTSGTSVTLTAYPTVGTAFSGWTGACAGQSNPCTLAMTADKATTANFTFLGYILTVNSSPALGGSISCQYSNGQSVSCRTPFLPDSTVILTAAPLNVPAPGYKLSSWTGCSSSVITCNLLMDTHKTVTANFVLKVFPPVELLIDDQLQGAGGKIRVPFGGTSILKWVGDGICTSNEFATGGAGSNTNPGVPTGPLTTVQTFSIDCVK
ncbi:hypothetical protein COU76_04195 [Candidatus Peregrinibacteria bacterium CG10_big_fil_rev_8_21_14_0_10_49_10]|nr:MAG: hypothetical protein COU76_04195 [Candidatus Peregrinibacteria bacterium CG10_big_fil_rev_8_21_14_0_10_49_10]